MKFNLFWISNMYIVFHFYNKYSIKRGFLPSYRRILSLDRNALLIVNGHDGQYVQRTWKNYRSDRTSCLLMKNNFAALFTAFLFVPSSSGMPFSLRGSTSTSQQQPLRLAFVFALRSLHIITHYLLVDLPRREKKSPTKKTRTTSRQKHTETQKNSLSYYSSQERNKQAKKQKSPFLVLLSLSVFQSKKSEVVVVNPIFSLSLSLSLSLYLSRRRVF